MSSAYLEKFRTSLPSTQGKQILRLLVSKKETGEIKTLEEFKTQLKQLTTDLLARQIKPTLNLWTAIAGEEISSEQHNDMLEKIHNDLETAFAEANTLDEVIEAHHQLIEHLALKVIRLGMNQLESQITLYEFLEKTTHGFDDSLYNTFRESELLNTSRADVNAALLYVDPRNGESILEDEDAKIDTVGERLILGSDKLSYITPKRASFLASASSARSELNVSFDNSDINHILDGEQNTYWAVPILLSNISNTGVSVEVQIEMNAFQDVNFIEIEPAVYFPVILSEIEYIDSNGTRQTAFATETTFSGPGSVNFNRITTNALILTFKQESYSEVQFKKRRGETNFYKAIIASPVTSNIDLDAATESLKNTLSSDFLLSEVFNIPDDLDEQKKYYEYVIGLDNIRVGHNSYLDRSIFVSKKKTVSKPGLLSLKVVETKPTQDAGTTTISIEDYTYPVRSSTEDDVFYHGAVEYWTVGQFYDPTGHLISTNYIPIFPLGANRIYHEKLIFTNKTVSTYVNKNAGSLMFYMAADASDIKVYRNATLLVQDTDWSFSSNAEITSTDPYSSSSRMKRGIEILYDTNPLDIYTVSYTPDLSNTFIQASTGQAQLSTVSVMADNEARIAKDNVVVIDKTIGSYEVDYADFYLIIIIRRTSSNGNVTPAIEEYMLITGSRDQEKFTKDY